MPSRTFFLLLLLSCSAAAQNGYYYSDTGKGHCSIRLGKDRTYEQQVFDCTYNFTTEGVCMQIADTLILQPSRIFYTSARNGKRKLLTDSTSASVVKSGRMNKYLVRNDTLVQLELFNGRYYPKWQLAKEDRGPKR